MKSKNFGLMALVLLLTACFLTSGSGQAWAQAGGRYKMEWENLEKDLNLTPEKAREFQSIGAKYSQARKDLIAKMEKDENDLEQAVAAPQPDEDRVKKLVPEVIAGHEQLFESFKAQRQEEMSLLTPLQQGKYLLALKKWHQEQCPPTQANK